MGPHSSPTSYGQVIEYIQGPLPSQHLPFCLSKLTPPSLTDRLYLASYTHAPTAQTPFPYPPPTNSSSSSRSPSKRSSVRAPAPAPTAPAQAPVYFSIDDSLLYNAFHHDFGPLHIGHLYRFAVQLHDILGDPDNEGRAVVFWSKADSRSESIPYNT